jgi:hypothetical protein
MRWARHVTSKEERRMQNFWRGNLRERDHLGDPGVDERIIVIVSYRNRLGGCELDRSGSG